MWDQEKDSWVQESYSIPAYTAEFWYAAPAMVEPKSANFNPLELPLTLHNARIASGRMIPMSAMHRSFSASQGRPEEPLDTYKRGYSREIEDYLEEVRKEVNPKAPSRMGCYFASASESTARARLSDFRQQRKIVRCRALADGPIHVADIRLFDALSPPFNREKAERYWAPFTDFGRLDSETHWEVLIGGSLYFPDWQTFPELDLSMVAWWMEIKKIVEEHKLPSEIWNHLLAIKAKSR